MDDGSHTGRGAAAVTWPSGTPRYRVAAPAADDEVALDVLAAVLDASPRPLAAAEFEIDAGRRADGDRTRSALADLSDDTRRLIVRDEAGDAVVVRRTDEFTVALPASLVEGLQADLPASVRDRIEQ